VLLREGVNRTERGTGQGTVKPEPGTRVVSVKRTSANDFDPAGDDEEHASEAPLAVDKEPGTAWTTEGYSSFDKDGVGIYVDADPGVDARSIAIDTPDPGWKAEIRVADGSSPPDEIGGWERVAGGAVDAKRKRFRLPGERHRYYLVWITALAPGDERVKISEITLFAPRT
jgi:serine/threonine-protein kinase